MSEVLSGNILITGGTGTLGHAIVRTALAQSWDCTFTIFSRSELLQAQMRARYPQARYILGDVRDYDRLAAAVAGHDMVIHAAAMKRVPECEAQPGECYQTNVIGSTNVVRACIAGNVKRCVGISTDKACAAITAYGASKLAMEKLFQAQPAASNWNSPETTMFTLVRYGNVVASRGSVIPLWRQQAAQRRPLTITDRRCTRFFMSEDDAVNLVCMAASAIPGTLWVPRMKAIGIAELAHIVAPGAELVEMGLRSCEKLHEDLVHPDEPGTRIDNHYRLWVADKVTGHRYSSDIAPKLTADEFLTMLAVAEAHE